jgi:hypothetical protein
VSLLDALCTNIIGNTNSCPAQDVIESIDVIVDTSISTSGGETPHTVSK